LLESPPPQRNSTGLRRLAKAPPPAYYPQSNGGIERWHKSLKGECIRPGTPLSLEDARRLVQGYVEHYNNVRLNGAIGYITPRGNSGGIVASRLMTDEKRLSRLTSILRC
jgi:transposase InsO family protein